MPTTWGQPELEGASDELLARAYRGAPLDAAGEMGLPLETVPQERPFGYDEVIG